MTDNTQPTTLASGEERKVYSAPAIVHELKLETRAGSPLRPPVLVDPLGTDPADLQTE
jgi:hypothetical protein